MPAGDAMRGYSATEVFSVWHQELRRKAEAGVEALPEIDGLRCHEVARAIGKWLPLLTGKSLDLAVVDGRYGAVEHSWLQLSPTLPTRRCPILDVYAVGRLPIVQLVDTSFWPQCLYEGGERRTDIDSIVVERLVGVLSKAFPPRQYGNCTAEYDHDFVVPSNDEAHCSRCKRLVADLHR
jgi:hypothetical protein